ncbi:MAG TPA: MobF family relaxase [Acidimicrobiales bacterium]|nr:MobF family relaxase [Acidimicrobiales bacterium]
MRGGRNARERLGDASVSGWPMLSIGPLGRDGAAGYYLEVVVGGVEDYYVAAGEAPGRWIGPAAADLGLHGEVQREDLEALLAGKDPRTGTRVATWLTRPGYDLTLSAPKSVSLLWALGDGRVAASVRQAHDEAVDAAIAYLDTEACLVRRGQGGRTRFPGSGLVAAGFRHRTSREADPQLHTHVLVANMTQGPDGEWSSLFGTMLYRHARAAGSIYQAVLRRHLGEWLGVRFGPVTKGYAEVVGIDHAARRSFSRRRIAIERAMAEHGVRSRRGAQVATLDTRPDKPTAMTEEALRAAWAERADEIGLDVTIALGRSGPIPALSSSDDELAHVLTEKDASFERRRVVEAVAQSGRYGLLLDEITSRVDDFLAGPQAVALPTGRWTTPEMLALEAEALDLANSVIAGPAPGGDVIEDALAGRPSLSSEQRRAVHHLTAAGPISLVVGHAGAGKTFALDAARAAWQAAGYEVLGCSLSARAARQLEASAGIRSDTADKLLTYLDTGRRALRTGSVVVVDETGMLGSRRLVRLLRHTRQARGKLVLVGDPKQLPEIDAGGLFAALARRVGHAALTENRRQRDRHERRAAGELRERNVEKALLRLNRSGRVSTDDNTDALRDRLVRDWHLETRAGADAVMLALHRSDVSDLNRRARARLAAAGDLGESLLAIGDLQLAEGDRVMALRNDRRLGLLNGTVGTVAGRTRNGLLVRTEAGDREIPLHYVADGNVTHAYALTVHKAQGLTCDVAMLLGDDTLFAEAGYTGLTRGRQRNQLYVVRGEDGDGLDPLRRALRRSAAKETAIEQLGLSR